MSSTIVSVSSQGTIVRQTIEALLSPAQQDQVRADANHWIKQLRLVRYGDRTMRECFLYRGDSLWWFTELYLHKMRRLERAIATVLALESARERHAPRQLIVETTEAVVAAAAHAFEAARNVTIDVRHLPPRTARIDRGLLVGVSAVLSRLRPTPPPRPARARVAAFVHTAFWRRGNDSDDSGRENYIGPVLEAILERVQTDQLRLIGVGPRRTFAARRWWDPLTRADTGPSVTSIEQLAPRRALADALALWRRRHALASELTAGEGIRAAAMYRDCDLWPVLSAELRDAAGIQWPWSARAMDEARAALRVVEPDVVITYAEAGGWGRALMLEARRASVPTVGLQHGFMYRHWLNYQHEADELVARGSDAGFPYPTHTLVFDRHAAESLETSGHLPAASIRITGSARLDELADRITRARGDRAGIRRELGLAHDDRLIVLAAKGTEIAPHLPALFAALRELPGVLLVIKAHPSETTEAYLGHRLATDRVEVAQPASDLGRLLAAADALVTMNSTVAIDGLVLGVPAIVIGLPNNLSPFVDAGVMVGANGDAIRLGMESVLYDRPARQALIERGARFAAAYQMQSDGGSAARAADDILALGGSRS